MSTTALAAVLAKFASLNVAGKAVAGLAVAAGAVGGVGGASAVADHAFQAPEPSHVAVVEQTRATLETTDRDRAAASAEDQTDTTEDAAGDADSDATVGAEVGAGVTGAGAADLPDAAAFGQRVAADARVDGVDGAEISTEARVKARLNAAVGDGAEVGADGAVDATAGVTGHVGGHN